MAFAPSKFASHSFKRFTPYSVLVYLDVCLKFRKVGVLIPSVESEQTIFCSLGILYAWANTLDK